MNVFKVKKKITILIVTFFLSLTHLVKVLNFKEQLIWPFFFFLSHDQWVVWWPGSGHLQVGAIPITEVICHSWFTWYPASSYSHRTTVSKFAGKSFLFLLIVSCMHNKINWYITDLNFDKLYSNTWTLIINKFIINTVWWHKILYQWSVCFKIIRWNKQGRPSLLHNQTLVK